MIATDAPDCREIVIQTGPLVPIEDPKALAQAIMKLATSPELRTRYGKAARELVVSKLSANVIGIRLSDSLISWRRHIRRGLKTLISAPQPVRRNLLLRRRRSGSML